MILIKGILKHTIWAMMSLFITCSILTGLVVVYFELQLPDVAVLKNIKLQVPLRIYTKDGKLIAEYGEKRRDPVELDQIPNYLVQAVLATEDQRYYEHPGVDPLGLLRAAIELVTTGTKSQGGSTITMQVARNFFLTREKTYTRKFKEILLAIKIDSELSKQRILELYLNKIYLGNRAYGVSAAAQVYYGKPLNQLNLPQMAMLAGLPKAPSALNPIANPKAAKERRGHVLERMLERGDITTTQYETAIHAPITATYHGEPILVNARYVAETVRDAVLDHYGETTYSAGYKVYTMINSEDQIAANRVLHKAIIDYDQRHGYRGSTENWGPLLDAQTIDQWRTKLTKIPTINGLQPAIVIDVEAGVSAAIKKQSATAILGNGQSITLAMTGITWARKIFTNKRDASKQWLGPKPKSAKEVLKVGDLIRVQHLVDKKRPDKSWRLAQLPKVQAALVALNPKDGAIFAMTGGFDFRSSNFNRAMQAERQPGSSFKPFIYAAALAKGYTLASLINDAPIVVNDPSSETLWRPQNDTQQFYGPTRLRIGLIRSRNLVSIRLLEDVGPDYAINYIARFGFDPKKLPHTLSLALGSAIVTPLELATGYAVFANGGYKINPYLIDHITDSEDNILYQAKPKIVCENAATLSQQCAPRVISPQIAYLMTSAMKSVITQGTGRAALVLKRRDLAGKTGTTNKQMDAWFAGFNSNMVTTVWMGFDQPQSLHEYGAQAALPMWINFVGTIIKGTPEETMSEPPQIVTVKIDPTTGLLAGVGEHNAIFEIFRKQYVPTQITTANSNSDNNVQSSENAGQGGNAGNAGEPTPSDNSSNFENDNNNNPGKETWGQPLF